VPSNADTVAGGQQLKPQPHHAKIRMYFKLLYSPRDIASICGCTVAEVLEVIEDEAGNVARLMADGGKQWWMARVLQTINLLQEFFPIALKSRDPKMSAEVRNLQMQLDSLFQTYMLASERSGGPKLDAKELARISAISTPDEKALIVQGHAETLFQVLKRVSEKMEGK
jgi:hypothetical protein